MPKLLKGKVALVTGAGRGLGWGIARALGRAGAKVCVSDITDELARYPLNNYRVTWRIVRKQVAIRLKFHDVGYSTWA